MNRYQFDWVDAVTLKPFGGNGCAVFYGAQDISTQDRMALVRETKLTECAFLVGSDKADFGVRYYLHDREILMAGHPTIATVRSLIHRGLIDISDGIVSLTLEVGFGVLPIDITIEKGEPLITMTQQQPAFGALADLQEVAAVVGLHADDIVGTPQVVSTGTEFCICILKSRSALERAELDRLRLIELQKRSGMKGIELFLAVLEGADVGDTYARLLLAPPNPAEDPFTGSATGCLAAYLWANGLIKSPIFTAEQGHGMGRPGQAKVEVLGARENISGIKVAGHGVILMEGSLLL